MQSTFCKCENDIATARVRCFEAALTEFYKARCMVYKLQDFNFSKIERVSEIVLDEGLEAKPIIAQLSESLVLRHFLEQYSQTHPLFAQETMSLGQIHTRLFKDL